MSDVDSPATGRRDIDEIEITDAMADAGVLELLGFDPRFEDEASAVRRIFLAVMAAKDSHP